METLAFDVDGVICETTGIDYANATPKKENIARINALYEAGNKIIIFTGRGTVSKIDWRELTEKQFAEWGLKYHELIFGKPPFDLFVDDHAWNIEDFEADNNLDSLRQRLCRVLDMFCAQDYDHEAIRPFQVQNMLQNLSLDYVWKLEALEAKRCANSLIRKS